MGRVLTFLHLDWEHPEIVVKFLQNKRHLTESGRYKDDTKWDKTRDFELMQYTGLKDKNGKEIYEGDIIAFPTYKTVIEWSDKHAAYKPWCEYMEGHDNIEEGEPIEVIGNIYENPELLK